MSIARALSDETRVRMLLALQGGELCVCQITELLGLAPSTVSKHLSLLYGAGLVNSRKAGRWMYYSLPGSDAAAPTREAIHWVAASLVDDPLTAEDSARLKKVLTLDATDLCKRQCRR